MKATASLSTLLLTIAVLARPVSADIITVDINGAGDFVKITDAVDSASKGDIIMVMPGTYVEEPISIPNRLLIILSTDGAAVTTITPSAPGDSLLICEAGDLTNLAVGGFTFASAQAEEPGGAMRISLGAEVQVSNCVFASNATDFCGGAVWVDDLSTAQFTDCEFIGNQADKDGGAVAQMGHDQVAFSRCLFRGNSAGLLGGAAYIGTTGGLAAEGNTPPSFDNCVFQGNSAGTEGGAIHIVPTYTAPLFGEAYLDNCTFTGNTAPGNGAIAVSTNHLTDWSGGVAVRNSICWNNQGEPIGFDFENGRPRSLPEYFYSCSDELTPDSPTTNTASDPRFRDTIGPDGIAGTGDEDLRLLPGSPCIDRGLSAIVNSATDLAGTDRIIDDPTTPNAIGVPARVDMGAFEFDAFQLNDLGIAFWTDSSGRLQPFMEATNWYDTLTPDPNLLAIMNGFTSSTQLPEVDQNTTIGPLTVTDGNFLFSTGNPKNPPVLSLGELTGSSPELSDLTIGPYLTDQAPGLILFDLVLQCRDVNLMRGSLQTPHAELELTGDLRIDGEKAVFASLQGGRIDSLDGEHEPSLVNLGELVPGGQLDIAGNYDQTGNRTDGTPANGNITYTLAIPGETINVAGTAELGGGASFFLDTDNLPAVGSQFTVLTADGGFGGTMFDFALTTQSADGRFVVLSQTSALGGGESVVATVVNADSLIQGDAVTQSLGIQLMDALLVDIDKDGLDDLVLSIDQGPELEGMVAVLLNEGVTGDEWNGFESYGAGTFVLNVGIGARGLDSGFANEDEYPDIFVACYYDGTIDVLENTSSTSPALLALSVSLSSDPDLPVNVSSGPLDVWAGDLDGTSDGLSEILVTNELDESVVCYQNLTGGGALASSVSISYGNPKKSQPGFLIGSFKPGAGGGVREQGPLGNNGTSDDKDGGVATAEPEPDDDGSLAGAGAGITLAWTTYDTDEGPTDVASGDLNGDGLPDVVTPNEVSDTISILLGAAGGNLQAASNIELGSGYSEPRSVAVGDFDGDNDQDIVVVCSNTTGSAITLILRNTLIPNGSYGLVVESEEGFVGQQPYLVRSSDVDNDGSDDIVALTETTTFAGGGSFGFGTSIVETDSCPADFTNDGSVGGPDLAQLLGAWNTTGTEFDLDGNGVVDAADLTMILAAWGSCSEAGAPVD